MRTLLVAVRLEQVPIGALDRGVLVKSHRKRNSFDENKGRKYMLEAWRKSVASVFLAFLPDHEMRG